MAAVAEEPPEAVEVSDVGLEDSTAEEVMTTGTRIPRTKQSLCHIVVDRHKEQHMMLGQNMSFRKRRKISSMAQAWPKHQEKCNTMTIRAG